MTPVPVTVCTIIAWNYLAQARVLAASLRDSNPGVRLVVLVVDRGMGPEPIPIDEFEVLMVEDLGIEGFAAMSFRYTLVELTTSVKPFLLEFLLRVRGIPRVLYLDPDIQVLGSLNRLLAHFEEAAILLTPHLLSPIEESGMPSEVAILQSGCFNLGFIGVRQDPETHRMLEWWKSRLRFGCLLESNRGYFVDQRWMDLAPCYFTGVRLLKDPGCNVAYWNLGERALELRECGWTVNGEPLTFVHFSGFRVDDPESISRHQTRHSLTRFPHLRPLFEGYRARLEAAGYHRFAGLKGAFDCFTNGVEIALVIRRIWQEGGGEARWASPFDSEVSGGFYQWMKTMVPGPFGRPGNLSQLAVEIHRRRPDLQRLFPDPLGADNRAYRLWFIADGTPNHNLPAALAGKPASLPVRVAVHLRGQLRQRLPERVFLALRRRLIWIWNWYRRWKN